jgi:hypothetical protein
MDSEKKRGGIFLAKGWLVLICAGITLGLVFVLAVAVYMLGVRGDTNDLVSELSDRGWPATLAELNDWYEQPPPDENAATLYIEAIELSAITNDAPEMDWPVGTPGPAGAMAAVDQYLGANASAIGKAREAMAFSSARYPVDYAAFRENPGALLTPWLNQIRGVARLLVLEANAYAEHGDPAAATESLLNAFHLAQSLRDAPSLLHGMVRVALFHHAVQGLEQVLARVDLTESQLAVLENAAAGAFSPRALERAFVGELCIVLDGPGYMSLLRFAVDRRHYLRFLTQFAEMGSQSLEEVLPAMARIQQELDELKYPQLLTPMTAMAVPSLIRTVPTFLGSTASYRTVQVALAIEKFRARHGMLPETLDTLTPEFLPSPIRPVFGDGPFQYSIEDLGYSLESPGYEPGQPPIVFTVTRVEES